MTEETLHHQGTTVVRRLVLAPGEATRWHRDPFHRVSLVFKGDVLAIEFRDGRSIEHVKVTPGQVDWDEPSDRIHRAVNIGATPYEEITVFFFAHPDDARNRMLHSAFCRLPVRYMWTGSGRVWLRFDGKSPSRQRTASALVVGTWNRWGDYTSACIAR